MSLRPVSLIVAFLALAPTALTSQEYEPWTGIQWGQYQPRSSSLNLNGVLDYKFRMASRMERGARVTYYQVWNPNEVPVRIFFWPASSLRASISYVGGEYGGLEFDTRRGDRPPVEYDLIGNATFTMRIELDEREVYSPARGLHYWTRPLEADARPSHRLRAQPEIRRVDAVVVTIFESSESGDASPEAQALGRALQQYQDGMRIEQRAAADAEAARAQETERLAREAAEREQRARELAAAQREHEEQMRRQAQAAERARAAQAPAAARAQATGAIDITQGYWTQTNDRGTLTVTYRFLPNGEWRRWWRNPKPLEEFGVNVLHIFASGSWTQNGTTIAMDLCRLIGKWYDVSTCLESRPDSPADAQSSDAQLEGEVLIQPFVAGEGNRDETWRLHLRQVDAIPDVDRCGRAWLDEGRFIGSRSNLEDTCRGL